MSINLFCNVDCYDNKLHGGGQMPFDKKKKLSSLSLCPPNNKINIILNGTTEY